MFRRSLRRGVAAVLLRERGQEATKVEEEDQDAKTWRRADRGWRKKKTGKKRKGEKEEKRKGGAALEEEDDDERKSQVGGVEKRSRIK